MQPYIGSINNRFCRGVATLSRGLERINAPRRVTRAVGQVTVVPAIYMIGGVDYSLHVATKLKRKLKRKIQGKPEGIIVSAPEPGESCAWDRVVPDDRTEDQNERAQMRDLLLSSGMSSADAELVLDDQAPQSQQGIMIASQLVNQD